MLDELNDASNELNIVVLDACRDNPFPWKRSGSRGLQVVGNQPSDSIIVFATSAGSTAAEGTGRNGLFTSHLLSNLKKPGLDVNEVFRLTMGDVARASSNQQRPTIYNQFSGLAYLGSRPVSALQPEPSPQPQLPAPSQTAKTFYDRGVQFANKGDYETAIADFTEAIRLDPNNKEAYNWRGSAYHNNNDYDWAIADYTQAIRIDPNYMSAYYNRGNAYSNKSDYDRAIADYTQAIRIDPNYMSAYYNRGNAYRNKSDYDRAIADYTQAIRIDPNFALSYNNRGFAYFSKKDYDRAIADYEAALKIDPSYTLAKNNLENARKAPMTQKAKSFYEQGVRVFKIGSYDTAIEDFTEAIRLDPNYADAYAFRGEAYFLKKDYDRAITDFTQAIRIDPNHAIAYNDRGTAYTSKKEYNRAIADFETALKINPNLTLAKNNLEAARKQWGR
jgi:tetratricopeptide (TPR) repeat protein